MNSSYPRRNRVTHWYVVRLEFEGGRVCYAGRTDVLSNNIAGAMVYPKRCAAEAALDKYLSEHATLSEHVGSPFRWGQVIKTM